MVKWIKRALLNKWNRLKYIDDGRVSVKSKKRGPPNPKNRLVSIYFNVRVICTGGHIEFLEFKNHWINLPLGMKIENLWVFKGEKIRIISIFPINFAYILKFKALKLRGGGNLNVYGMIT